MIVFLCRALKNPVRLSNEHTECEWIDIKYAKTKLNPFFHPDIDNYTNNFMKKLK